jgi:dTDP-4-dehydrorhamnose 3,5-epimerase-like enzyme
MNSSGELVECAEITCHADLRGVVFEPLTADQLSRQLNVHVVITAPGGVRGNHYHPFGRETLAIMGPALVRLREQGQLRDLRVPAGEAFQLIIPPGVSHAFQNMGDIPNLMVAFNTIRHNPEHPDVIKDMLL